MASVFTIAIAILAIVYWQRLQQQEQMDKQLAQAQMNIGKVQIAKLVADKTKLEAQLGEATSQLEIAQARLSRPVESSTVTRTLFDVAENHRLEVIEMTSSVPSKGKLAGVEFSLMSLTARVEGDTGNIIGFIIDLNNHFSTGIIRNVSIIIPEASSGEKATADVRMVIYTYEG